MTNETPHKENFNHATLISNIQRLLMIIGSLLSLLTIFLSNNSLKKFLDILICIISILYLIFDFLFIHFYRKAGDEKIKDLIDNGLNSKLSNRNSKNYYTNDEIKEGIPKLGINNFESVFFTKSIVHKMIRKKSIPFIIIAVIYLVSIFFFEKDILVKILQLLLPIQIAKEFIFLWCFNSNIEHIYEDYINIYNTTKENERAPLIIKNIILYEKLLSTYQILTDCKIYRNLNSELSEEWLNIKEKYSIK
jgi:hypothetical protein cdifQCD-6_21210